MPTTGALVMGIDGGGSKTTALLSDHPDHVLAVGTGGPANFQTGGIENARRALDAAVTEAFAQAGLSPGPLAAVCLGLAGVSRPGDEAWALAWAEAWGWRLVKIFNDTELLLWAVAPGGWGVAVISGTGSMVFGRAADGRAARAGGWGPLLGDEGSGYAMGLSALRAVVRAADGRARPTLLTGLLLDRLNLSDPMELIQVVYQDGLPRAEIASLAEWVAQAAAQADPVALEIERQSAGELALAFTAVGRTLGLSGALPCALGGGVLVHNRRFAAELISQATGPVFWPQPVTVVTRPAEGALRRAWQEVMP